MEDCAQRLQTFDEICGYVSETLSRLEALDPQRFELHKRVLNRAGRPCAVQFRLDGPRALQLSAIWETDGNTILFYGSCGRRMQRTLLVDAPTLDLGIVGATQC